MSLFCFMFVGLGLMCFRVWLIIFVGKLLVLYIYSVIRELWWFMFVLVCWGSNVDVIFCGVFLMMVGFVSFLL